MDVPKLKRLVKQAYKDCGSYQDSGWLLETKPDRQATAKRIEFSTWFIRPGKFRFDWCAFQTYTDEVSRSSIWSNGSEVFFRQASGEREKVHSLVQELKKFRGVSRGISFHVPSLLLEANNTFLDSDFTSISESSFENITCYRLERAIEKELLRLDVDKADLLIRQITEEGEVDAGAIFDAKTFAKVSGDLANAGASPEAVLRPFLSISEIRYKSVCINPTIAPEIVQGPS